MPMRDAAGRPEATTIIGVHARVESIRACPDALERGPAHGKFAPNPLSGRQDSVS